ncbi:unnamed protein product [Peniophora sp. CBMAI 1063]|nr:unnamed protein product [Peniophora sp. CBMAI 1063]
MSTSSELDRWPTYAKHEVLPVPSDPEGHVASVTAIAFSRRGDFIAIASVRHTTQGDNGLIQVYAMDDVLSIKRAVNIPAHPTALVWYKSVLIIGDRTGDVTLIDCDYLEPEAEHNQENWAGGEIRALAVADNYVALGTPAWVQIAKLRARSWYRAGAWYDRRVVQFPSSAASALRVEQHSPVALDFTSDCSILVVTYERDGIVGSSALSPRASVLAATNLSGGIDMYTLDGQNPKHDRTLPLKRTGVNRAIPIVFIHDGAGILVGSTHGVARVLTSRGNLMQYFAVDAEQNLVQEVAYAVSGERHYMAFGTADSSGANVVAIYRSHETSLRITGRKIKETVISALSIMTVLFLLLVVFLGTLSLWRWYSGDGGRDTWVPMISVQSRDGGVLAQDIPSLDDYLVMGLAKGDHILDEAMAFVDGFDPDAQFGESESQGPWSSAVASMLRTVNV